MLGGTGNDSERSMDSYPHLEKSFYFWRKRTEQVPWGYLKTKTCCSFPPIGGTLRCLQHHVYMCGLSWYSVGGGAQHLGGEGFAFPRLSLAFFGIRKDFLWRIEGLQLYPLPFHPKSGEPLSFSSTTPKRKKENK